MNLLICTQAVDKNEPVLGFMHRWIEELAGMSDRVTIICRRAGEYSLPPHVEVIPLGERWRFLRAMEACAITLARRSEYDRVFVHMNQEYVLAAGWLWKLLGKPIYLWRNHYAGSVLTDLASLFCTKVFCTSRFSYTAKYKKAVLMPVGVDTTIFKPVASQKARSALFLARVAPSKRVDLFVEALALLAKRGVSFSADVYGDALPKDTAYRDQRIARVEGLGLAHMLRFHAGVPNAKTPEIYSAHEIFVNCSESGMYDKTIFEAASCGCIVLASSRDYADLAGPQLYFEEASDLAESIERLLALPQGEKDKLRARMRDLARQHSLSALIEKLRKEMASKE